MQHLPPIRATRHHALPYAQGLLLQKETLGEIASAPDAPERLLFVEHTPVITLGRSGGGEHLLRDEQELRAQGIEFFRAGRGGDVTYHGPGQWTVYPLLRLEERGRDLHRYMRLLEEAVILYLHDTHGITAGRRTGRTGVWVEEKKICAIGIAVSRWISWHGFALNINTDLRPLREYMVPCGISPAEGGVTSLAELTGREYELDTEAEHIARAFTEAFPGHCTFA